MKKISLLFSCCWLLTACYSQETLCKHLKQNSSSPPLSWERELGGEVTLADSLRSDTIDILKTTINLQITDFTNKIIAGNTQIDFVPKVNGISTLSLDLLKLIIDSIEINNSNLTYSYNDTLLVVNLPSIINIGDTVSLTVFYHGTPQVDASGWGGFYFTASEAYNLGVGFAADPHVYGRVWFPCFDNFVERSKYEFNIKTNGGKIAYCNGTLAKDTTDANGFRTRTFILDETIPSYLVMVAVGNYAQLNWSFVSISGDTIPLILSDIPSDTTNLKNSFVNLKNAIACFENRYGPFAWKKMGYAVVPFGSGAMEHATNVTYPRPFVNGSTAYEDVLMAHELSHQWWGDHATCHNQGDMWINEGMATFSQFIFNECVYGQTAYKNKVRANHEDGVHYTHIHNGGYLPISPASHANTYDSYLVYNKGADMAHTMRGYLGDSLFFLGLKYVQANNSFTDISSMKFRDDMTFATGVNMNDFFSGWVFSGGWPHFSIDSFSSVPNGGNYDVTIYIKQKLDGAPNLFNNVPLEITFKDAGWNEITKTLNVSGLNTIATVTIPFNPVFTGVDLNEKISDAITSDMKVLKATGTSFSATANGRMQIAVQAITPNDSAFMLVEHNWAPPDSFKTPNLNYKLSPYHFWKVSGILPSLFDATGSITYDGRAILSGGNGYLDHQLLTATNQEDSIALLYRKDPSSDWNWFPYYTKTMNNLTDKFGTIKIDSLLLGEYSIALLKSGNNSIVESKNENTILIYPNPSEGKIWISIPSGQVALTGGSGSQYKIEIHNVLGECVYKSLIPARSTGEPNSKSLIDLSSRPGGIYFLRLKTSDGTTVKKIVKE